MADADTSIDVDMLAHGDVEEAEDPHGEATSDVELIAASESRANHGINPDSTTMQFDPPLIQSQENSPVPFSALGEALYEKAVKRNGLAVIVPPAQNRWEYRVFVEDEGVDEILEEYDDAGFVEYLVLFSDGSEDVVSYLLRRPILQHMLPWLPPPLPSLISFLHHYVHSFSLFHLYHSTPSST